MAATAGNDSLPFAPATHVPERMKERVGPPSGSRVLRSCLRARIAGTESSKALTARAVKGMAARLALELQELEPVTGGELSLCHQHRLVVAHVVLWRDALVRHRSPATAVLCTPGQHDSDGGERWTCCGGANLSCPRMRAETCPELILVLSHPRSAAALEGALVDVLRVLFPSVDPAHVVEGGGDRGFLLFWECARPAVDAQLHRPPLEFACDLLVRHRRPGLWLEFGVASGRTLRLMADAALQIDKNANVFGFDSFHGLPERWQGGSFKAGLFDRGGLPPDISQEGVTFVVGLFDDTLVPFLSEHLDCVAIAHIDCDLYSSSATVLSALRERLVVGSLLVFDELVGYGGAHSHEMRAVWEELVCCGVELRWHGCQGPGGKAVLAEVVANSGTGE